MSSILDFSLDEKFLYFLVKKEGFQDGDLLYLPIDVTPKSGSTYCRNYDISFERPCDFLIVIHGKNDSRVMVQKRYDVLRAIYDGEYYHDDSYANPPEADSPEFVNIYLPLVLSRSIFNPVGTVDFGVKYETGKLRYGNGNPKAEAFDSLADFIFSGDYIEMRIPWQLLNFSNPSDMMIHDDYYECYGIENLHIQGIYVGVGEKDENRHRIPMEYVPMEGWGRKVTYHERLKKSYYMLQDYWTKGEGGSSSGK